MARTKIDYGVDLGTTNSAISRMENGKPVIKKTDRLKDTMPSCVFVNKKKTVQVGDSAYNALKSDKLKLMRDFKSKGSNAFIEFKRTMGTDKIYHSSNMEKDFSSEELSAEVLKTLKSFVSDENFKSIVVTVPAKFTVNQKDATLRATKLAGFEHCELLQEPIAASMAYGLDRKSENGYWLVFDFGGGTFDAAVIKVEDGIMKVIDTEGDNFLGGKNLDYAIVDEIIIPYIKANFAIESILSNERKKSILRDAMKFYAEETKIQMSYNDTYNILSDLGDIPGEDDEGVEFELDITVTQALIEQTFAPIFQKAIDICKDLLERNNISLTSLEYLILVGGPTYSPVLRKMLEEQIKKPDVSVDPMTVVSKGAALFASTVNLSDEIKEQQRDKTKIQLEFGYEATSVEEEEFVTIKILKDKAQGVLPKNVLVDLVRSDKAWSSGKTEINEKGDIIEVKLNIGKSNSFDVIAYNEKGDIIPSEPTSFTIIQGSKIGSATLPYNIGIEIKNRSSGKIEFKTIPGLEKNQSTPATGTANGLEIQDLIRPGIQEDIIRIPLYQGQHGADGTNPIYHEHIYDIIITGEDVPKLLPEGSLVDLTVKVDSSERITLYAFFPVLEHTHEVDVPNNTKQKEIDAYWLEKEIIKAQQTLNLIKQESFNSDQQKLDKLEIEIAETKKQFEQSKEDYDRKKEVLNNLRRNFITLNKIQDESEWPKTEEALKDVFYRLEEVNRKFGNEKTNSIVEHLKEQIPDIIKERNVKVATEMIDNMRQLDFSLVDKGLGVKFEISLLHNFKDDFDILDWKDKNRAGTILDKGLQMAVNNPSKENLREIVIELYNLLPDTQKPLISDGIGNVLIG